MSSQLYGSEMEAGWGGRLSHSILSLISMKSGWGSHLSLVEEGVSSSPMWLSPELLFIDTAETRSFFSSGEEACSLLPEAAHIPSQGAAPILKNHNA